MSDKDVDAQFADIVAHWDDVAPGADTATDRSPERPAVAPEPTSDPLEGYAGELRPGVNPPLRPAGNPTNPPPTGPFVVWRGAESGAQQPDPEAATGDATAGAADPDELADLDDEEHFVPGPTAPLPPQEDLSFWGIVVGLVAGPLLLLWLVLFRPDVSGWWTLASLGLTVGGFVLLVLRQPHSRDEDDPDNGARV